MTDLLFLVNTTWDTVGLGKGAKLKWGGFKVAWAGQ
jgi:hypothetical protein